MKRIGYWLVDYLYLAHGQLSTFIYRNPPKHYLGLIKENKIPIIIIPGVLEKWTFLKPLADKISLEGHPVYIIPKLGYNIKDIPKSAVIVKELIEENKINDAVIIAHSKGGLIGKYLLIHLSEEIKMISIATPYSGTSLAKYMPHKRLREFHADSEIIKELESNKNVNRRIISISPVFDNHVLQGSFLEGAENLTVNERGHHKVVYNKDLVKIILSKL